MNTLDFDSPELLKERADELRAQLTAIDWRNDRAALDPIVDGLRDIAERDWYVAADAWRESGTDAPLPEFIDPATDLALELRYQSAERGQHREVKEPPAGPQEHKIDKVEPGQAANEPIAKNPANEPQKPVAEHLTDLDLVAVKAARKQDRSRAEAMLREVAEQTRAPPRRRASIPRPIQRRVGRSRTRAAPGRSSDPHEDPQAGGGPVCGARGQVRRPQNREAPF